MPATVTLAQTALLLRIRPEDRAVCVASVTNIAPGLQLWVDQELMGVVSLGLPSTGGTMVNVLRGRAGTASAYHSNGAVVFIGRGDQFYAVDPKGAPIDNIPVSPYINTTNGTMWLAEGDEIPGTTRWWQPVTQSYDFGALGVRTTTQVPSS